MKLHLFTVPITLLACSLDAQRPNRGAIWEHLAKTYDKNGDGKVSKEEHGRGDRAFRNLDRDGDGAITSADFERRRGAGRRRGGQRRSGNPSAAKKRDPRAELAYRIADMLGSFLNQDGKPGIDKAEWKQVVARLKPADDGTIPNENLGALLGLAGEGRMARMGSRRLPRLFDTDQDGAITVDEMHAIFARLDADGDGNIEEGKEIDLPPGPGEMAPDFTLPFAKDAKKTVTLSSFRGKKPVALIFGSYT